MMKEARFKQKMKAQQKGQRATFNFELPEVRSSTELLQKIKIKREKIISNLGETNTPLKEVEGHGQNQKNPPEVSCQNKDPKNIVGTSQKKLTRDALVTQSKGLRQNEAPKGKVVSTSKNNLTKEVSMPQCKGSKQNQDPKSKVVSTSQNKLTKETPMTQSKGSIQIQNPKKQAMKRVVIENDGSMANQQSIAKKIKRTPMCPPMLINEFLEENGEFGEEEDESEDEQNAMEKEEENAYQEEDDDGNIIEGTSKKRTRGPTRCLKIHARDAQDRKEVVLDNHGEPIGPDDKTVSDLSNFLGTLARNADFCPLVYTNFKALPNAYKDRIWDYVNTKYNISEKGKKAVFSRINDSWRRYKCFIKRKHFMKYSNSRERLKHRPEFIPEDHFKQLMTYWTNNTIQNISKKNAMNRAKQKYMHRMGPINFARIRARLHAKKENGEEVTQAEMFIETRQSRKGKELDEETQTAIAKLQDSIQNSKESAGHTFESLFGKEKSGKVRCFGRTVTPSMLKKDEEIAALKKQHSNEMTTMAKKMEGLEALVKCFIKQNNPHLDDEALNNIMGTALGNDNSAAPRSSTSTNIPLQDDELGEEEHHLEDIEEE